MNLAAAFALAQSQEFTERVKIASYIQALHVNQNIIPNGSNNEYLSRRLADSILQEQTTPVTSIAFAVACLEDFPNAPADENIQLGVTAVWDAIAGCIPAAPTAPGSSTNEGG